MEAAGIIALYDDARPELLVESEDGKNEQQYVAFEPEHLDMLLKKFASASI